MANARLVGKDELIEKIRAWPDKLRGEVTRQAVTEGAEVFRREILAGAPRGSKEHKGRQDHIAQSIILYERRNPEVYLQAEKDNAISMLVGPSKLAFHAYFIEHGWRASGRARTVTMRDIPRGGTKQAKTRRLARKSGAGAAHGQKGIEEYKWIEGTNWIDDAYQRSRARAIEAVKAVYRDMIERLS